MAYIKSERANRFFSKYVNKIVLYIPYLNRPIQLQTVVRVYLEYQNYGGYEKIQERIDSYLVWMNNKNYVVSERLFFHEQNFNNDLSSPTILLTKTIVESS